MRALKIAFCLCLFHLPASTEEEAWDSRALLRVLDHDDAQVRDVAEAELRRRCPKIEALLEEAAGWDDLGEEAKARVRSLQATSRLRRLAAVRFDRQAQVRLPGGEARLLRFSPDGKRLAGISDSGRVAVWEVPGGRLVSAFDAPFGRYEIEALVFGRSGAELAIAGSDGVCVCTIDEDGRAATRSGEVDAQTWSAEALAAIALGRAAMEFTPRPPDWARDFRVSPSGTTAAWTQENQRFFADAAHPQGEPRPWGSDGRDILAIGDDGGTATRFQKNLWIRGAQVTECAFCAAASPGADAVAATTPLHFLEVWSSDGTAAWSRTIRGEASTLALGPGGTVAAVSIAGRGVALETASSEILLAGLPSACETLFFTADSRFLVLACASALVMDASTGEARGLGIPVRAAAPWGRGAEFVVSTPAGLRRWSGESGEFVSPEPLGETDEWADVAPDPAGRAVAVVRSDGTGFLSREDGTIAELGGGFDPGCFRWSPDGATLLAADFRGRLHVRQLEASGAERASESSENSYIRALAWSPDGRRVAWASKRDSRCAAAEDLSEAVPLGEQLSWVGFVENDLLVVLESDRRTMSFRLLPDGDSVGARVISDTPIRHAALSPDRKRLAIAEDGIVTLLNVGK